MWKLGRMVLFGAACYAAGMFTSSNQEGEYSLETQQDQVIIQDHVQDTTYSLDTLLADHAFAKHVRAYESRH